MIAVWSDPAFDDRIGNTLFYLYDVGAAVMAFTLAALERGLIVNQIAGFKQKPIAELIGIPHSGRVIVLLAVGYPSTPFSKNKLQRKELSEIIALNTAYRSQHPRYERAPEFGRKSASSVNETLFGYN